MLRLGRQKVTILMPLLIEERGEIVEDWTQPIRTPVSGCSVQPGEGDRDFEHASAVIADATVFMPSRVQIDGIARFELPNQDGQFILLGAPEAWAVGLSTDHVRVRLRKRVG